MGGKRGTKRNTRKKQKGKEKKKQQKLTDADERARSQCDRSFFGCALRSSIHHCGEQDLPLARTVYLPCHTLVTPAISAGGLRVSQGLCTPWRDCIPYRTVTGDGIHRAQINPQGCAHYWSRGNRPGQRWGGLHSPKLILIGSIGTPRPRGRPHWMQGHWPNHSAQARGFRCAVIGSTLKARTDC